MPAACQGRGDGAGGHSRRIETVYVIIVGDAGGTADARGATLSGEIQLHASLVEFGQDLVFTVLRLRQSLYQQKRTQ